MDPEIGQAVEVYMGSWHDGVKRWHAGYVVDGEKGRPSRLVKVCTRPSVIRVDVELMRPPEVVW